MSSKRHRTPAGGTRARRLPLFIASLLALSVTAACSSSGGSSGGSGDSPGGADTGTVTLGFAGGGNLDTYYKQIVTAAEAALPGIKVKTVSYPTYDDQLNQMPQQLAAGTIPDVIVWDNSAPVAQYAQQGAIRSLDDLATQNKIDLSAFPDALVKSWKIDGKLYGIPSYLQNSAFVFNKDLLKKAGITTQPTTMDEVATAARTVKAKTGKPGLVLLDNLFHLTQYALAFGGGWGNGKTINSAQNKAGLQYLVDLFSQGAATTPNKLGATWDGEAIANNKAAMSDGGPWYIGFMQSSAPKLSYALTPVPAADGGSPFVATYGGSYSISAHAKAPKAAMKLISFLTNEQSEKAIITTKTGFVPARSTYIQQYRTSAPQYSAITDSLLANGKTLDYPVKAVQFGNALVAGFENITARKSGSVSALLDDLQKQYGS